WLPVSIGSVDVAPTTSWSHSWKDIFWMGKRGWLCGAIEEGGGGGDVGRGLLLHTTDRGSSWRQIDRSGFECGEGSFTWGPRGTRVYQWKDVGPIYTVRFYNR